MSKLTEILVGVAAICVIFFAVVFIMDAKEAADREADRQEFAEIAESIGGSSRSTVTTRPSPYPTTSWLTSTTVPTVSGWRVTPTTCPSAPPTLGTD